MSAEILERYIACHMQACKGDLVHFSWHGGESTLAGIGYYRHILDLQKTLCPPGKSFTNTIQTNGTLIDRRWSQFLAENRFSVGLSIDGPGELHDEYRRTKGGKTTFDKVMKGYTTLMEYGVPVDLLCVVSDYNVLYPLQVYGFFKSIGATHLSFLPLVEPCRNDTIVNVSTRSVDPESFGAFLCVIFDEWKAADIGRIKIQIFEEALRTAFHQEHSLCIFRPVCGDIPVLEQNGDIFVCDHFVDPAWKVGNIVESSLVEILESETLKLFGSAKREKLTTICRNCDVLPMCYGECPKNRFVPVAGEVEKQNYLCPGYQLFFRHCRPFIHAVAEQWQQGRSPENKE